MPRIWIMMATGAGVLALLSNTRLQAAAPAAETLVAWERYRAATEARIGAELEADAGYLALDFLAAGEAADLRRRLRAGDIVTLKRRTTAADGRAIEVPGGLVHHWLGSVFIPGADVESLVVWLQDYDAHHLYFDEVEASRLIRRRDDEFEIFLRLRRKKIVTVHYHTDHRVRYERHGRGRVSSRSTALRIAELDAAGTPSEVEKAPSEDRGFLWRLNSYWRFQQVDDGVIVELESVSLSRGVPGAVRWLVGRYLDSVPRESLEATLAPIREAGGLRHERPRELSRR